MSVSGKIMILFLAVNLAAEMSFAQGKPEKFSYDFLNALINYDEVKLKGFVSSDTAEQKLMMEKLKELYDKKITPIKTPKLTSSVRAILKGGNEKYKQLADIIITISPDQTTKYELTLWGCYVKEGKWILGEKFDFNKILKM